MSVFVACNLVMIKNENNLTAAIGYIKSHPRWRLSLQTHKIINIR